MCHDRLCRQQPTIRQILNSAKLMAQATGEVVISASPV
jgi:hypothetical protein